MNGQEGTKTNVMSPSNQSASPLNIVIAGAGIGGLYAAISLRNAGHRVSIYESSRFAVETGAAIHLPPNVNGLLRRIGMIPEDHGAVVCEWVTEREAGGAEIFTKDLRGLKFAFPYPWQLIHRIDLHNSLKEIASRKDGGGIPVVIHLQSRTVEVDVEKATITLQDGTMVQGDLVIGADGVNSITRKAVIGKETIPFPSGTSCFRFLIPASKIKEDPATAHFVERAGNMIMVTGNGRRIVMYPCRNNTELNFVAMHPDSESRGSTDDWNQSGSIENLLKVFDEYSDDVKALLKKAEPETIKLWNLLDLEELPVWTKGNVALLGDAAHPFLPHQGQGGAQAMEDGAALGALFPLGTRVSDIPEILKLYVKCRYERATIVQEYSRQAGPKHIGGVRKVPNMDAMQFTGFNFNHDAYDHALSALKRHQVSMSSFQRMPVSFGPNPGPRQNLRGEPRAMNATARYQTAFMTFKTKKSYLQTLMPSPDFNIAAQGGWTTATFSVTSLENLGWLGGRGYIHFGLYLHNVKYTGTLDPSFEALEQPDKSGDILPVLFENMADPIITGREELGFSKVFATMETIKSDDSYCLDAGWEGTSFCKLELAGLVAEDEAFPVEGAPIYHHKVVPSSKGDGKLDADYTTVSRLKLGDGLKEKRWKAASAKISFCDLQDGDLETAFPTLANIIDGLRKIEVTNVIDAGIRSSH